MTSIPEPGLHQIADPDYFAIDLPSSSQTKTLLERTNAHLAYDRETAREESDALTVGSLLHALLLAPDTVDAAFIKTGRIDRRTTAGKAEWETVQRRAALTGARIVTDDQVQLAEAMARAVRSNLDAAVLLNTAAMREVTAIGTIGDRPAKAKIDAIVRHAGATIIVDIKTCERADPTAFARSAATYGYFHQAAWYSRLLNQHLPPVDDFLIIAVEKSPPHLVAVYRIPSTAIIAADQHLEALAARWWAVREGDRSGYPLGIQTLTPPAWWIATATEGEDRNG